MSLGKHEKWVRMSLKILYLYALFMLHRHKYNTFQLMKMLGTSNISKTMTHKLTMTRKSWLWSYFTQFYLHLSILATTAISIVAKKFPQTSSLPFSLSSNTMMRISISLLCRRPSSCPYSTFSHTCIFLSILSIFIQYLSWIYLPQVSFVRLDNSKKVTTLISN